MLLSAVHRLVHLRLEVFVEILQHVGPLLLAFGDGIEFLLHLGGEIVVEHIGEVFEQEVVHHESDVCRQQFALLAAHGLCLLCGWDGVSLQRVDGECALVALAVAFLHVSSLLYGADGWCVG